MDKIVGIIEQVMGAVAQAEKQGGTGEEKHEYARVIFKALSPLSDAIDGVIFAVAVKIGVKILQRLGWDSVLDAMGVA